MTVFSGARCPVTSCPANLGERGTTCDYLWHGWPCRHPLYREAWAAAHELERTLAQEAGAPRIPAPVTPARSILARVEAAQRPMSQERARQLAFQFEGVGE